MHRLPDWTVALSIALCLLAAGVTPADDHRQVFEQRIKPFLKTYCGDCHGADSPEADFHVGEYPQFADVATNGRKHWAKVVDMLSGGEMPPPDALQPQADERKFIASWLAEQRDAIDCVTQARPGRVTVRRLNRAEYRNTIRDLLGVDYAPAAEFPADDVGYGFDNIGDVLSLPPVLMEKYLAAAEEITTEAIPERAGPEFDQLFAPGDLTLVNANAGRERIVVTSSGGVRCEIDVPRAGRYRIAFAAAGDQAGDEPCEAGLSVDGQDPQVIKVPNRRDEPRVFEHRFRLAQGKRTIRLAFLNDYYNPQRREDRNLHVMGIRVEGPLPDDAEEFPSSDSDLLVARPSLLLSAREASEEVLRRLSSRAFRRPVRREELRRLLQLAELARQRGASYEGSIRLASQALLVSPYFLFRIEADPSGAETVRTLDEFELATRLSYFLWSSMPDEELFRLARENRLREQLKPQIQRMLRDPKSDALVENFAAQWLELRNLEDVEPDSKLFPTFNDELRAAMAEETKRFFLHVIREDRPVTDLLDSDYTFVNETLARHYGIAGVSGPEFRRVSLAGTPRGGVLTQASVLTVTSNPTRTSPVKRGKWVLDNLLGTPPPPAPANVPELEDEGRELQGTLRERMVQHRENPSCAACHQRMDPLGFALENFDAVGRYRELDEGSQIDARGEFPSGESFNGARELRALLAKKRREDFVRCLSEKLLTYALGRGLEYYDKCAVDRITAGLAAKDDRFSQLVLEIALSDPFQKRGRKTE